MSEYIYNPKRIIKCDTCGQSIQLLCSELDGSERFCYFCGASLGYLASWYKNTNDFSICDQDCSRCPFTACRMPNKRFVEWTNEFTQI